MEEMTEGQSRDETQRAQHRPAPATGGLSRSRVVRSVRVAGILGAALLLLHGTPVGAAEGPAGSAPSPARPAAGPAGDECLECHTGGNLSPITRGGKSVPLDIDPAVLHSSAHVGLRCVQCHVGFDPEETPHRDPITAVDCAACHKELGPGHGYHAPVRAVGRAGPPTRLSCKDCHGAHDVVPIERKGARPGARDVTVACARCHSAEIGHYRQSAHGRAAAQALAGAPGCLTCHNQPITFARVGADTVAIKQKQEKLCLSCHLDDPVVRARMTPGAGFIAAYENSVHGKALLAGNAKAANCVDCHGSHEMAKGLGPGSRVNKAHIPGTCGRCHSEIQQQYTASVHGTALAEGSPDTPVCTDCHGEHSIAKANAPESPVAPANVSQRVCSPCHSSVRLAAKYGIRSDRFRTFNDSFHGLAIRGGLVSAANCASCHGSHEILPSSDPRSSINPANLIHTCGQCHPGANTQFASGKVHVEATRAEEPLLFWISTIYVILILVTVGGMFLHNALDFYRKARHRLLVRRGLAASPPPVPHALYLRMTLSERLQHGALMLSFTLLVITGFMLRYPEAWWVEPLRRFGPALFDLRSLIHRISGVILIAASLAHVVYLTRTRRGREFMRDILLRPGDLKDIVGTLRYYAGRTRERPRFGRFSYVEKTEYWALVWGTGVMGLTGVVMWFQDPFIALLTKLGWDAARTVHFYEAILATLAIVVWHLYFVIFNPDVYPMNVAWIKGTITEEEMEEEHPLELEEIRRRRRQLEEEEERAAAASESAGAAAEPGAAPSEQASVRKQQGGTP
jgi:formate dehydrogenase gamma subunit